MSSDLIILLPPANPAKVDINAVDTGTVTDSFSIEAQGFGSFSGLKYEVPAHTEGMIKAKVQIPAFTSIDIENLNNLIKGMLSASQYEKVYNYERTHASANIGFWGVWGGGGNASYEKIHEDLKGFGLSEENIKSIIQAMCNVAQKMSDVEIEFKVLNKDNSYSVSGSLMLYTVAGYVRMNNETFQYRVFSSEGVAGFNGNTAPAKITYKNPN